MAPIFLWGYFLSGVSSPASFTLAFVAYHIFLYGGITAFNSYYDRDVGPVGGLIAPPQVTEPLLPFSLAVLLGGAVIAALVNGTSLGIYLCILAMGLAYSHPIIRLKARPFLGLATVAVGQGLLATLAGWSSAQPDLSAIDPISWLGILGGTLVTAGFYPITQVYQIEEDRARGDMTFAVWAGSTRAFAVSVTVQALGAVLVAIAIANRLGLPQAILLTAFYAALLVGTSAQVAGFQQLGVRQQHRRVMLLNVLMSVAFGLFLIVHLARLH